MPAPVVAAVVHAAASASQATQELVQRFTAPAPARTEADAPARPKMKHQEAPKPRPQRPKAVPESTPALAGLVAEVAPAPADSTELTLPAKLTSLGPTPVAKNTSMMQAVRSRISDAKGRPLSGATVLVPGTLLATTTNATSDYMLSVPAGTSLKFGYAGFANEVLRTSSTASSSTYNVVLTPEAEATERPRRRR